MKHLSSILILTVVVFASACSKGNYAQVEPSESYYSQKNQNYVQPAYSASANANVTGEYDETYQNQHSPSFTSTTLGSPTIQQYEETFYNSSQNPDLVGQNLPNSGGSDVYFVEDFAVNDLVRADLIPETNNKFYYGDSPYYTNLYPVGDYFSMSFYLSTYFAIRPWYDPFNPYFSPFYFSPRLGNRPFRRGWNMFSDFYMPFYSINPYCPPGYQNGFFYNNYYGGTNDPNGTGYRSGYRDNNAYSYYGTPDNSGYAVYGSIVNDGSNGGRLTDGTPISRSSVSYYANSGRKIQRREDYSANDNIGGRIAENDSRTRTERSSVTSKQRSEKGARTASDYTRNTYQKQPVGSSSMTLQRNDNTRRRTVVKVNTSSPQNTGVKRNSNRRHRSNNYTGRSNTRQNIVSNRSNQSRYSNHSGNTRTGSSLNRSRTSTSYSGSRNSSPNRSYSAPSRSSVSNRSAAPRPSSVQRSSGQRSSSSGSRSSSSSSGGRKN